MIGTKLFLFSLFILLPIELNSILKKKSRKQNFIKLGSFSNSKVVFVLLREVMELFVGLTIINVRGLGFEIVPK